MKIILNEKEMEQLNNYWKTCKKVDYSKDTQDMFSNIENKIADMTTREDNGDRIIEIEEDKTLRTLKCAEFVMNDTMDAAQDIMSASRVMTGEWKTIGLKIASFAMKTMILHNRFTRNFYNSISYYVASLKGAYDKTLTMKFDEEDKDAVPDDPKEVAKEQWGVL